MAPRSLFGLAGSACFMAVAAVLPSAGRQDSPADEGAKLYKSRCASCHGADGTGGKGYSRALIGNKSESELAKYIEKFMPPSGKKLSTADSQKVASYAYDAFYSPLAQERNRPARVTLARLTVKQHKNAVMDLVGSFAPAWAADQPDGLKGTYFKDRDRSEKGKAFDRVDKSVDFDFGAEAPVKEGFDPYNFSIRWEGSILAPDTGEYELVIQSNQAVRLWLNGWRTPLIDGMVKSANEVEHTAPVNLLGGRTYPVLLEFSKATQGVAEQDKAKQKPPGKAFIRLMWRRPKMAVETIPSRFLFSKWSPVKFVSQTPFPPDDRSIGYERGSSVSKEWEEACTNLALETATYVERNLQDLSGIDPSKPENKDKVLNSLKQFVGRAFRRPLTAEEEDLYIKRQIAKSPDMMQGVKKSIILTLVSPRFLYREVGGRGDAFAKAAHLSFGLWDTLPDNELLDAAAQGRLNSQEGIEQQAGRLARNPRAWVKYRDFLLAWLKVDDNPELVKSKKAFPEFDPGLAADLRNSLELTLESDCRSDNSTYRELMLGSKVFLNGRLSKIYGGGVAEGSDFQPVDLNPEIRSGILTHPYLLSRFAYIENTSPIHRGVLLARNVMGRSLKPPPIAVAPLANDLAPGLTTRERVSLQTKPNACNSCHSMINPLGFSLEKFDAIGRIREQDNGKPVDSSGGYQPKAGEAVTFGGPKELAHYIASSPEAHASFVEKLLHHLVKQPARAYGPNLLPELNKDFEAKNLSTRALMVDIITKTALALEKAE